MRLSRWILFIAFGCTLSMPDGVGRASSSPTGLPFRVGESLTYEVSWLGVRVGKATMRIEPASHPTGDEVLHLISLARTYPFFDTFYKVDDRVESLFDPCTLVPRFFRIGQREGRYRNDREMIFDQSNHRVTYRKNDKPPQIITTDTTVQDPLSVLYAVRTMPLPVGQSISVPIFDRGKTWVAKVRVVKRERLTLSIGAINTIKVQPFVHGSGIFRHKGNIFVWLSDDAQRIPVQMSSNILIGAVKARLIEAQGVDLTQ